MDTPRWWVAVLVDTCEVGNAGDRVYYRRTDFSTDQFYVLGSYKGEQTVFRAHMSLACLRLKSWRQRSTAYRVAARSPEKLEWIRASNPTEELSRSL